MKSLEQTIARIKQITALETEISVFLVSIMMLTIHLKVGRFAATFSTCIIILTQSSRGRLFKLLPDFYPDNSVTFQKVWVEI